MRKLAGDGFPLAFDSNTGYSTSGAISVDRGLEYPGFWRLEEPVPHDHFRNTTEARSIKNMMKDQDFIARIDHRVEV
jgi:L-alanine-DL-glutamate epimerase-like enolase superfamily enzyme